MGKRKATFYAVRVGVKPGIYSSWADCEKNVKGFPRAEHKGFPTKEEAAEYLRQPSKGGGNRRLSESALQIMLLARSDDEIEDAGEEAEGGEVQKRRKCRDEDEISEEDIWKRRRVALDEEEAKEPRGVAGPLGGASITPPTSEPAAPRIDHSSFLPVARIRPSDAVPFDWSQTDPSVMIEVYTDGSCLGNGTSRHARAGYGVWFGYEDSRNISERLPGEVQTNNRAELMATIKALEVIPTRQRVRLHTDSTYVRKGITHWITAWKKRGWKGVKNRDLWELLDEQMDRRADGIVKFVYVKAHCGILGNEEADRLANEGAWR